jgi:endonuclease/exonuclease/phosphatase (EEP) superfamily protein YafD
MPAGSTTSLKDRHRPPGAAHRLKVASLSLSALLCVALALCYGTRSDRCAAVTILPTWAWIAPGLVLATLAWSRRTRRAVVAVGLLWIVYLLAFAEEAGSLVRLRAWPAAEWQAARARGRALRVVSLNCAGGSAEAAGEVATYQPDLVLLQESPGRREVERLARRLFGSQGAALVGPDASLIARGSLAPAPLAPGLRATFVQARVRFACGIVAEVISLRLTPAIVRLDFWSPDCWREQTDNRRVRREQLRAVAARVAAQPPDTPLIVGGDFNAPAGDAIFRLFRPRLRDTFRESGLGWGDTILNEIPLQRIDQVWTSAPFHCTAVVARRTRASDHRMVICDLLPG